MVGRSPPADTAARTCHYFDKVEMNFFAFDPLDQTSGIGKTADDRGSYRDIADRDFSSHREFVFPCAADVFECVCIRIFSGYKEISGTKSRFHNASGRAEDHTGTGTILHQLVTYLIFQCRRGDVGGTDHAGQFPGSQHKIHIMTGIFFIEEFHIALAFFCGTRHNGNGTDIFRIDTDRFGKIGFHHCSEHLLWRFGSGKLFDQMRILGFDETDPARTAGGEHRTVF
ncbi:unknown [Lachnospiraceae bacterium CAG:215]|nr:unknown [Lachnospiraceae bacterium CAG:215]